MSRTQKRNSRRKSPNDEAKSYRQAMAVTEQIVYHSQNSHYMCPRCGVPLEREFSTYCDRCGQKLDWKHYKNAKCLFVQGK